MEKKMYGLYHYSYKYGVEWVAKLYCISESIEKLENYYKEAKTHYWFPSGQLVDEDEHDACRRCSYRQHFFVQEVTVL